MKKQPTSAGGLALWLFVILLLLIIILGGITMLEKHEDTPVSMDVLANSRMADDESQSPTEPPTEAPTEPVTTPRTFDFDYIEIQSETALLTDFNGNELYSENQYETVYPASLTKIMTAIVAIENVYNLDETIMITGEIYDKIYAENGATAGFLAYEDVTYRDLLYGTLLSSGAECCLTLANYISGSEWDYVQLMNEKAQELGMSDTNFTNVCGFHDANHYTTAADISLLLQYALKNETFFEIFTSESYYTETDQHPSGITLSSTMFTTMDSPYITGGKMLGGKTGFTDQAGLCLASIAEIDGEYYTLVTMGAPGSHYTEPMHIDDALVIYERISEDYENGIANEETTDETTDVYY